MRVLQCLTTGEIGGTELAVLDLTDGLRRAGFEVDVCVFYPPGPLTRRFTALGVRVVHLGSAPRVSASSMWRFVRLLRRGAYDLVHLYGARVNFVGRLGAAMVGRSGVVAALRSVFPGDTDRRSTLWLDRATLRWVDAYVSNSRTAIEFLIAQGFPRSIFSYVPTGLRVEAFGGPSSRDGAPVPLGIASRERPVVISVANLRPMKGHQVLVEALDRLQASGQEFVAVLVGDGPLRGRVEADLQRRGLADRVVLTGVREDVSELLAAADVFVLASLWEGLPRSILEAMASGLPVVATAVGGVQELVTDGRTGFLVPPGDAQGLAARLANLLSDAKLRAVMGAEARARVHAEFSLDRMVAETASLYREVARLPHRAL